MVFSSTVFLFLFLPLTLVLYYNPFFSNRKFRNIVLLAASLLFYAWGEPVYVGLMVISIFMGWFIGLRIEKTKNKSCKQMALWLGCCFHIGMLFIFKYLSFTLRQFGFPIESLANIALPIGISFFTFQILSYILDIYYGKAHAKQNPLDVGLYIALFPQLIAGPIVRYDTIEKQLYQRKETVDYFCEGMQRFIYGLGKKVLIANYMAQIADNIFMGRTELSVATAWFGAIAYTLQIYFDFSGYSDMAIGLGKMFGFKFPENFAYPYISRSVTEFWRRWHISLGLWFRDYVYIPLGGNRVGKMRWIGNLFIVWGLTGLWHGANWTFIVWGLFYFGLLLFEKITGFVDKLGIIGHIYALIAIILGWVIFRSASITSGIDYLAVMLGFSDAALVDNVFYYYLSGSWEILMLAVILSVPIWPYFQKKFEYKAFWQFAEPVIAAAIFIISLLVSVGDSYNPFIYFNF